MDLNKFQQSLVYYSNNPIKFIEHFIPKFIPTEQQKQVLELLPTAIKKDKSISIKSSHGVGKSALAAIILLWFLTIYPDPKILATAPSRAQIMDVLWSEVAKWKQNFVLGEMFEWTKTRIYNKNYPETAWASARTSNSPEAMSGIHSKHVLLIFDEASGISNDVYEALEGAETETGALKILLSNPTQTTGGFYDSFHAKSEDYYNFTFSGYNSARVKPEYMEKMKRRYGEDSNVFRVRCLGEFPLQEDDVVIGIDVVERAQERFMDLDDLPLTGEEISFGVDVARFGDDEGSIYVNIGDIIIKEKILIKKDTMEMASILTNLRNVKYKNFKKAYFNIDETGVGSGVVDRMRQLQNDGVIPDDDVINGIANNMKAINNDEYGNIISELWFNLRDFLKDNGKLCPDDLEDINNIQQQLCSRKYGLDSKGKIVIEKKELVKKRINGSPDRADGAVLSLANRILKGNLLYSDDNREEEKHVDELKEKNIEFNAKQNMIDRMRFYRKQG